MDLNEENDELDVLWAWRLLRAVFANAVAKSGVDSGAPLDMTEVVWLARAAVRLWGSEELKVHRSLKRSGAIVGSQCRRKGRDTWKSCIRLRPG